MPKQRRLTDLYIVGTELAFDDGEGEPISVFVRKLNPVDHETALRNANAARSRAAAIKSDPGSDEYLALRSLVSDYDLDSLLTYLVEDQRNARSGVVEARVADDEEWTKDNYLQGLQDAPESDDAEGVRVKAELQRFRAQVAADLDAELRDFRETLEERPLEELQDTVFDKILDVRASIAWLTEFRRCEVWLSARETDRKTRYFLNREEVDELPSEVYQRLSDTYLAISVEPIEGKDSAATPPSSPSSEQQGELATDESSGPTVAAA